MSKRSIDSFRRETARKLRLDQTEAEARLWRHLRHWPMQGTHFRRQVPIGPYVVDFACMAARLVVELDGSQHGIDENIARDAGRTGWLEAAGYRVIRFWNNDLINNMDGVLESIRVALHGASNAEPAPFRHRRTQRHHPTPARQAARRPSPSRGG